MVYIPWADPPPSNSDYKENKDCIIVLVNSYSTTITGGGPRKVFPLRFT